MKNQIWSYIRTSKSYVFYILKTQRATVKSVLSYSFECLVFLNANFKKRSDTSITPKCALTHYFVSKHFCITCIDAQCLNHHVLTIFSNFEHR